MTDRPLPPNEPETADWLAQDEAEGMAVEPITQWKLFRVRFGRHRLAMMASILLLAMVVLVIVADWVPGLKDPLVKNYSEESGLLMIRVGPRAEFPFGTDGLGRDMLSRVVYGGRTSLVVAGLTGLLVASIGTSVGAVSGYYGGWVDQALMRFTDLILSLPLLVETDLTRFLGALKARSSGIFRVQGCRLSRLGDASFEATNQPRLQAECELLWFTVAQTQGGTQ